MRALALLAATALLLLALPVGSNAPAHGPSGYASYLVSAGDTHLHSTNSDGNAPISTVVDVGKSRNLSWVVITDHNLAPPPGQCEAETTPTFLCIKGTEVTMAGGHVTTPGIDGDIPAPNATYSMSDAMDEAYAQGGLAFVAHPFVEPGYGEDYDFFGVHENYTGLEVYHGWGGWNEDPDPSTDMDEMAVQKWNEVLNAGRRMVGIGASDSHDANATWDMGDLFNLRGAIGYPRTVAYLREFSERGVLEALERGRVVVTDGPELELEVQGGIVGDELRVDAGAVLAVNLTGVANVSSDVRVIANGAVVYTQGVPAGPFSLSTTYTANADSWIRAEVRNFNINFAMGEIYDAFANPVYVDVPPYDAPPEPPTGLAAWIEGDDVVLSWNASTSVDVDHYAVYRAGSIGGFEFDYRHARPRLTTWRDRGAVWDGETHYYIVRAVDRMGHEDNNTAMAAKMRFAVVPGMKLLSMPLRVLDDNVTTVVQTVNYSSVRTFNAFDADPWKTYATAKSSNDLAAIPMGAAFWLNATLAGEYVIAGIVPPVVNVPMRAGWNLVSYASHTPQTVGVALAALPWTRAESWDPQTPYHLRVADTGDILDPGAGLWVRLASDAIWTLSP